MPRDRFFAVSVGPDVMSAPAAKEAPATFQESLLQVAAFHSCKCTPIGVHELHGNRRSVARRRPTRPLPLSSRARSFNSSYVTARHSPKCCSRGSKRFPRKKSTSSGPTRLRRGTKTFLAAGRPRSTATRCSRRFGRGSGEALQVSCRSPSRVRGASRVFRRTDPRSRPGLGDKFIEDVEASVRTIRESTPRAARPSRAELAELCRAAESSTVP